MREKVRRSPEVSHDGMTFCKLRRKRYSVTKCFVVPVGHNFNGLEMI